MPLHVLHVPGPPAHGGPGRGRGQVRRLHDPAHHRLRVAGAGDGDGRLQLGGGAEILTLFLFLDEPERGFWTGKEKLYFITSPPT
jgi:hypothetical protein